MRNEAGKILQHYMQSWNLIYDSDGFHTHCSLIQPVIYKDIKAILKITFSIEEKRGNKLMLWYNGKGAAKVLKCDDGAILMERVIGDQSLRTMALNNRDDEATRIICRTANLLHADRNKGLPELIPLNIWFNELFLSAGKYGSPFTECAGIAKPLLDGQNDITVLHGDLHHDNILYSPERGWLAIDPKGLLGERAFDYANILCNPDKEIALSKNRLTKQIDVISKNTGINYNHLLKWTIAWAGLSAVWFLNDNMDASLPKSVAEIALKELNN